MLSPIRRPSSHGRSHLHEIWAAQIEFDEQKKKNQRQVQSQLGRRGKYLGRVEGK